MRLCSHRSIVYGVASMHFSFWEKAGFALLVAAWVAFGSHMLGNTLVHATNLEKPAFMVEMVDTGGDKKKGDDAPAENALTLLASADAAAGAKVFTKCKACHTIEKGGKNKVGPNLWSVVGRKQGSAPGFSYSGAIAGLGGTWGYGELDQFLTSPKDYAKGNKMTFAGVKKASQRAAVILFLRSNSDNPLPLP